MEEVPVSHTRWSRYLQVCDYILIWKNCTESEADPCNQKLRKRAFITNANEPIKVVDKRSALGI